jgi:hypothetical protein
MTDQNIRRTPFLGQLLLLLMAAVFVYLVVTFVQQVAASQEQREERDRLAQEINAAGAEKTELAQELDRALSDDTVAEWAHTMGLSTENEALVIPYGGQQGSSTDPEESLEPATGVDASRDTWLELFFGKR